jgi:hypothetical protein
MSWKLFLNNTGNGIIYSGDCDGDGVKLTGTRDVKELVESIDIILREGDSRNFLREDGALIEIYVSQSRPGKYVIERSQGAWIRLEREELRDLRNELLRRIGNGRNNKHQSETDCEQPEDAMDNMMRKIKQASDMNTQLANDSYERLSGLVDLLEKARRWKK